jgi:hypothetical protein
MRAIIIMLLLFPLHATAAPTAAQQEAAWLWCLPLVWSFISPGERSRAARAAFQFGRNCRRIGFSG